MVKRLISTKDDLLKYLLFIPYGDEIWVRLEGDSVISDVLSPNLKAHILELLNEKSGQYPRRT